MRSTLDKLQTSGWTTYVMDAMIALDGDAEIDDIWGWLEANLSGRTFRSIESWRGQVIAVLLCHRDGHGDSLFSYVEPLAQLRFRLVDQLRAAPNLARLVKRALNPRYDTEFSGTDLYLLGLVLYELGRNYTATGLIERALAGDLDPVLAMNAQCILELCLAKLEF